MTFLDKVYREYVYKHKFTKNEIVSIKSVAGSGKTTTLLELAKIHKNKKILYIAFNKSLITEIKGKIVDQKIRNLNPCTFDSLMRSVFISKYDDEFELMDLKPQTLPNVISWFANKPYRIKNYYVKAYNKFCNQTRYSDINEYCKKVLGGEKKLLSQMWQKSLNHELITFDFIRKYVEMESLCKNYIDSKYDLIFIDESQDFDNVMLKILLEHTTIPKLFVGDPKQAIYEWKGCINAFDKLPSTTLALEFYSTFRVGLPACNEIRDKFKSCNIISRSKNITNILYDVVPTEKYVYLFRGWKNLLQTAQNLENIWIHNFDSQIEFIKRLHNKMQISNLDEDELNEFSDDLPKFLLKLSLEDLEKLINSIQKNVVVKNKCNVEMYTVHSYKGLESDIVRIFNDIELPKDENLYYVALTRGMKQIILDTVKPIYEDTKDAKETKKQMKMKYFGINTIILE
jgi:ATP-dependent exoDNAse (exonuclease V) beta subunit